MSAWTDITIKTHELTYDVKTDDLVLALKGKGSMNGEEFSGTIHLMRIPRKVPNRGLMNLYRTAIAVSGFAFAPEGDFTTALGDLVATYLSVRGSDVQSVLPFSDPRLSAAAHTLWFDLVGESVRLSASTSPKVEKAYRDTCEAHPYLTPEQRSELSPYRMRAKKVLAYLAAHPDAAFPELREAMDCSESMARNTLAQMVTGKEIEYHVTKESRKRLYNLVR